MTFSTPSHFFSVKSSKAKEAFCHPENSGSFACISLSLNRLFSALTAQTLSVFSQVRIQTGNTQSICLFNWITSELEHLFLFFFNEGERSLKICLPPVITVIMQLFQQLNSGEWNPVSSVWNTHANIREQEHILLNLFPEVNIYCWRTHFESWETVKTLH